MKPISFIILLSFLLSSCQSTDKPILEGSDIITTDQAEINKLTKTVVKALVTKDGTPILGILADELKNSLNNYPKKIQEIVSSVSLDSSNLLRNIVYECEVMNGLFTKVGRVTSRENHFTYTIPVRGRTYVRLFTLPAADPYEKYLITTIYYKKSGKWLLGNFYIGYYSFYGRNAEDLYSEVTLNTYKQNYVLAFLYITMMEVCMNPADGNLIYDSQTEMMSDIAELRTKIQEVTGIPAKVKELKTQPEIFELRTKLTHRIPSPIVYYKTNIPLSKTTELEKENLLLHDQIDNYLPKATAIFDSVYYVAVNEFPNQYHAVDQVYYARLAELKK